MVGVGRAVAVVELKLDRQRLLVVRLGLLKTPLFLGDNAELMVGASRAVAVVELKLDLQRFLAVRFGLLKTPLFLGDHAELMVGVGRDVAVVELKLDLQRFLVVRLGLLKTPLFLDNHAELMVGDGRAAAVVELLAEGELGLMVCARIIEMVLFERCDTGEVVHVGKLCPSIACAGLADGLDHLLEELAASVLLAGLVKELLKRLDEGRDGMAVSQGVVNGSSEVGVLGVREGSACSALVWLTAREESMERRPQLLVEVVVGARDRSCKLGLVGETGA